MVYKTPMGARPPIAAYVVAAGDPGWRVDRMASERLGLASRAKARKLLKAGDILLNGAGVESSRFVHEGDRIELLQPAAPPPVYEHPLDVVYCDDHLAAVHKPPGLVVSGNRHRTVEHALLFNLPPSPADDALPFPRPVHRLDARTAGLLLVARSARGQVGLGRAFEERRVQKRYRAIVRGRLDGEGVVDEDVDGKSARTRWAAVQHTRGLEVDWMTTVDAWPASGRKHQIRVHLASLGHPVLGDAMYTDGGPVLRSQGLFLFAAELTFDHPVTGEELTLKLDEPPKYDAFRCRQQRRWERHSGSSSD